MDKNGVVEVAKDMVDYKLGRLRHILPHLPRFCFFLTFFEDSARIYFQFSNFVKFANLLWEYGTFVGTLVVLLMVLAHLLGAFYELFKKHTKNAVEILTGMVIWETVGLSIGSEIFLGIYICLED